MNEIDYKERIKKFSEDMKKYKEICDDVWSLSNGLYGMTNDKKLLDSEEKLREKLVFEWGFLENVFKKLGIETIASAYGRQFSIFDQALDSEFLNNLIKRNSLKLAVQSSIKAVGKIESVNLEEFKFEEDNFHPRIKSGKCLNLYNDGHYPESVENSFKIVRDRLRELTGFEKGADAFGKGRLYIRGASAPHVDGDFQKGVQFLCMAIDMFRNEKAHFADGNISDSSRAKEYLNLSNLLMYLLDRAEIRKNKNEK